MLRFTTTINHLPPRGNIVRFSEATRDFCVPVWKEQGRRTNFSTDYIMSIINKWLLCHITHLTPPDADMESAGMSLP